MITAATWSNLTVIQCIDIWVLLTLNCQYFDQWHFTSREKQLSISYKIRLICSKLIHHPTSFSLPIKALQLPKKLHPSNIVCFIEPDGKTSRPFSLTWWKMSQWYVPLCTNLFCRRGYYLLNFVLCIVILNLFCYTHILGHIVRHTISCAITVPAATSRKFCHVFHRGKETRPFHIFPMKNKISALTVLCITY